MQKKLSGICWNKNYKNWVAKIVRKAVNTGSKLTPGLFYVHLFIYLIYYILNIISYFFWETLTILFSKYPVITRFTPAVVNSRYCRRVMRKEMPLFYQVCHGHNERRDVQFLNILFSIKNQYSQQSPNFINLLNENWTKLSEMVIVQGAFSLYIILSHNDIKWLIIRNFIVNKQIEIYRYICICNNKKYKLSHITSCLN